LMRLALATNRPFFTLISRKGGLLSRGRLRAYSIHSPAAKPTPQVGTDLHPDLEVRIESKVDQEEPAQRHSTALVAKHSTALTCIEPWRCGLPVVQTS
jgi:hypothetical protein